MGTTDAEIRFGKASPILALMLLMCGFCHETITRQIERRCSNGLRWSALITGLSTPLHEVIAAGKVNLEHWCWI